ncbi:MAG: hypothetical protein ACLQME_07900 [Alphaproteobacteria bacterium]
MGAPRHVVIDGKPYLWRDLLRLRREQRKAARQAQPALFELKEDARPPTQTTARGRYAEPLLFG